MYKQTGTIHPCREVDGWRFVTRCKLGAIHATTCDRPSRRWHTWQPSYRAVVEHRPHGANEAHYEYCDVVSVDGGWMPAAGR